MSEAHCPRSAAELAALLAANALPAVRLCGLGSQRTPPPPAAAARVSLRRLDGIDRLDADDLTCSVQPGLPRQDLDAALRPHGLELACAGTGTLGGIFAADRFGPLAPGGPSARSQLLGLEAVLASGTAFKSGARVVKSVAGFDLHKLFVGSAGRLFAATRLHLRLRKAPRARAAFATPPLPLAAALQRFAALRRLPVPPARLLLDCRGDAGTLRGCCEGRASFVAAWLREQAMAEVEGVSEPGLEPAAGEVLLLGALPPSRLPALLSQLPAAAALQVQGGGRFELCLPAAAATAVLAALPALGAAAGVAAGAAELCGRGTPLDPGAERLQQRLARAFDPAGVLV